MSCNSTREHSRFIDNYESINYLAEGSSCKVYVARHKLTGSQHAVKFVMKSLNEFNLNGDKVLNEIKIMDGLKHENIVNFKYAWVENHHKEWLADQEESFFNIIENNTVYSGNKSPYLFIAMEYCGKGSLDTWLKNNPETPENTLIEMMQQVVCGLAYLHSKNIIHRDIKPMNIFIDDENIAKIGDLGIARFMSNKNENVELEILDKEKVIKFETYTKHRGTDGYIAPEQKSHYYNEKVDIWALGVVFLKVFCKNLSNHQIKLANEGKFPSDLKMENNRLMRLIKTMIEINTNQRISANDLFMALHGLRYSSRLPNEKWLRKSDEKQPFPYRNDKITSFNQMANEKGLKGVTNITDKFTDSLTEEEIGSLFKVLKEDKGQTIANIMSVGMEYMVSVLKILQCVQTDQNLNTIDSEFAKMKSITDKLESSNKPNEN